MIDPNKKQISCITKLEHQKKYLNVEEEIILPYPFPFFEGIIWDYDTFLGLIYRRVIDIKEECGIIITRTKLAKVNPARWDFLLKINKIHQGKCILSDTADNLYTFIMNVNILGGNLKDSIDNSAQGKNKTEIKFLQNITMPFKLGPLQMIIQEFV